METTTRLETRHNAYCSAKRTAPVTEHSCRADYFLPTRLYHLSVFQNPTCLENLVFCAHAFTCKDSPTDFKLKSLICEIFINLFHMCLLRNCVGREESVNNLPCYVTEEIRTPSIYADIERGHYLPPGFDRICFVKHARSEPHNDVGLMITIEFDSRFIQLRNQYFINPSLVMPASSHIQDEEVRDWDLELLEKEVGVIPNDFDVYFE